MSVETDLFTTLGPLVSGRAYPSTFPQDALWPAIRYTFVAVSPFADLCGDDGLTTAEFRVQIDVVAKQFAAMHALMVQVMAAMVTFVPPAICILMIDDYDAETKGHRGTLDYLIHPSSPS